MIAIGLIRGISARYVGAHNPTWNTLWVQIESCVSVIVVCITAFRTLIVSPKTSRKTPRSYRRLLYQQPLWREKKYGPELPNVPMGATMTGMRTMIRENGRTIVGSFAFDEPTLSTKDQDSVTQSHDSSTLAKSNEHGTTCASGAWANPEVFCCMRSVTRWSISGDWKKKKKPQKFLFLVDGLV